MNYEDIYYLVDIIHTFVNINGTFYDNNGTLIFKIKKNVPIKINNSFSTKIIKNIINMLLYKPYNHVYIYKDQLNMHYMSTLVNDEGLIILGPYLSNNPVNIKDHLLDYMNTLPILNRPKLMKICDLINSIKSKTIISSEINTNFPIKEHTPRLVNNSIEHTQTISNIINQRYKLENEILHLISYGNFEEVKKIFLNHRNIMTLDDRIPDNPLRCAKNYLIIDNTAFRKAIELAGVPPIYIHNISEKFALKIEKITSMEEYYELLAVMIEEYCILANKHSTQSYSPIVKQTIEFIMSNVNQKLSTKYIADQLHINASYLSRQFKIETGKTLVKYIQEIKIDESKYYLLQGNHLITQIAYLLGFNDSNYFTRVFKKITGTTPHKFVKDSS